jgi:hypothetical protein
MDANKVPESLRGVSVGAIIFGIAGAAFYWWLPMGMMLSLTGLTLSFVDWVSARRRSVDFRLSIVGLVISVAALALNIVIAALGLQTLTFGW